MPVKNYDPKDVNVVVDGSNLTGIADGTFVTASQNEDNFVPYVGAKGEITRAHNADKTGSVSVTLKRTSPSNAKLSALAASGEIVSVRVVDVNDNVTSVGGSNAWVVKPADYGAGEETPEVEWEFFIADYQQYTID